MSDLMANNGVQFIMSDYNDFGWHSAYSIRVAKFHGEKKINEGKSTRYGLKTLQNWHSKIIHVFAAIKAIGLPILKEVRSQEIVL